MQQNKKGSILLYVLFLSSFLVLFFMSFQGEMNTLLNRSIQSEQDIQTMNQISDALIILKTQPVDIYQINDNSIYILKSHSLSGTILTENLGGEKSQEYLIGSNHIADTLTLTMLEGGPIVYNLASFNSGSESSAINTASGIISSNQSISISSSFDTHIFTTDPLGSYAKYMINTSNSTVLPPTSLYNLWDNSRGYLLGTYAVNHFIPKSRSNFDYQGMGMYLKE